ncbi:MAG: FtsH protease activity modulator HflK [Steroidobacteraceae bacterium]
MAWNEPGGRGESPWGRRPANQGGLDGLLASAQRRLEALLKGGSGGNGSSSPPAGSDGSGQLTVMVIVAIVVLWLAAGFFKVDASERAVIQRFGKFLEVRNPGLSWRLPWPVDTVTKVNVSKVNSVEYRSRMLTADVNLVDIRSAIQYQYADPVKVLFQVREPESTLREVSESAIREVVGQAALEAVLGAQRQEVSTRTRDLIQRTLDTYNSGIRVLSVNLTDLQVPEAVLASQRDANKAIEDRDRFSKEAESYANDILPKAVGAAQRLMQDAEAYKAQILAQAEGDVARFESVYNAYSQAPEVTRQRLYIETIEQVMQRSKKVVIDAKSGTNGNVLYLPLDKLVGTGPTGRVTVDAPPASGRTQEMDAVTIDGRDARARGER